MRRASLLLIVLLGAGCSSLNLRIAESMLADRLFCGLTIPGGGTVTEPEWRAFINEEVTPRFPDGLTIWVAEGQWRGADGVIVREPVLIIEVVHRHNLRSDRDLYDVAEAYKKRFRQEAVMRVTVPAMMEMIE